MTTTLTLSRLENELCILRKCDDGTYFYEDRDGNVSYVQEDELLKIHPHLPAVIMHCNSDERDYGAAWAHAYLRRTFAHWGNKSITLFCKRHCSGATEEKTQTCIPWRIVNLTDDEVTLKACGITLSTSIIAGKEVVTHFANADFVVNKDWLEQHYPGAFHRLRVANDLDLEDDLVCQALRGDAQKPVIAQSTPPIFFG